MRLLQWMWEVALALTALPLFAMPSPRVGVCAGCRGRAGVAAAQPAAFPALAARAPWGAHSDARAW